MSSMKHIGSYRRVVAGGVDSDFFKVAAVWMILQKKYYHVGLEGAA